jgi:hypothetical protein
MTIQNDRASAEEWDPKLSVILITPDGCDTIRPVLRHLQAQSVSRELEIVVVAPAKEAIQLEAPELQGFHSVEVVPYAGLMSSTSAARANAVRIARAPLVAFVEDHSFPQPGWAKAFLIAHKGVWAAVGPSVGNANPERLISWANLLIEYAPWLEVSQPQELEHLPAHNSSYKRAILLNYGEALDLMLEAESVLHWDLRKKGFKLRLDSEARTLHLNYSSIRASTKLRFHAGRIFSAARSRDWSTRRRLVYAVAGPLIPLIRVLRIFRHARARFWNKLPTGTFEVLFLLLLCDAAGEMAGYIFGSGSEASRAGKFEFHQDRQRVASSR